MELDLVTIHHIFTIFASFLFSFYLLFSKIKERKANIYISLFILNIGLDSLDVLLTGNFYPEYPELAMILPAMAFLFYPSMYFYIKSVAFKGFKLQWKDSIHLIVFIAIVIILLFEYHFQPAEEKIKRLTTTNGFDSWFLPVTYVVLHIQALTYMVLSIREVVKFKKIVEENYSNLEKRDYKWILQLTIVFVYLIVTGLIRNILRFSIYPSIDDILFYILGPLNIMFLIWVIYKAMSQPYLFNGIDANIKLLEELLKGKETRDKQSDKIAQKDELSSQENELKLKIENYMITQEPFLDASLTIFDLAKGLDLSTTELSVFINRRLNRKFFDFVNEYRIKKAMEIFKNSNDEKLTVLEVLYEVGFNSKSSFNTAFKKFTGTTPSEFKRNASNSAA